MEPTYNERKWLSPTTHSSSYVMCYYDPQCPNDALRCFLRIADCSSAVTFTGARRVKYAITAILRVISEEKKSVRFLYRYRARMVCKASGDRHLS